MHMGGVDAAWRQHVLCQLDDNAASSLQNHRDELQSPHLTCISIPEKPSNASRKATRSDREYLYYGVKSHVFRKWLELSS